MGKSLPPPAGFDLVGSFARRRGSDVELVLSKPTTQISQSPGTVTLRKGNASVEATAEFSDGPGGPKLTMRAPRDRFADGVYSLTLQLGAGSHQELDARLLVQGERPIVLLWGATGYKSMIPTARSDDSKRRAAAKAGKALDRALTVLSEDKAKKVRSRARKVARKVLN